MQPDGSQAMPCRRLAIVHVARRRRRRRASPRPRSRRGPHAARQAVRQPRAAPRVSPSADTSKSGRGVVTAHSAAASISGTPLKRNGVRNRAQQQQARGTEQQRPGAEGVNAADRAGQMRHPQHDADNPADAVTHQPPEHGIEAERQRQHAKNAHRHDPDGDHRHRQNIGEHAIGRQAMEVVGGVRHGGEPGDHRGKGDRRDLAPAPQRHARAPTRCRLLACHGSPY